VSRYVFKKDELDFIQGYAYGHSYKEITQAFNEKFPPGVDEAKIKSCLGNHRIKTGRTGRFEKGHEPANKGKHTATTGRMAETQFKKGNVPQNHLPVGSVRVRRSYKGRKPYVWEKVEEPNVWRMKHVIEYESFLYNIN
jgi:hypothetical protein